jgi:hypothetical protein
MCRDAEEGILHPYHFSGVEYDHKGAMIKLEDVCNNIFAL